MSQDFRDRQLNIKLARDKFLRLHKLLMDADRLIYEREHGRLSSGQFLELLMGSKRFAWLRAISTLIVRIDEAFDLDDGLSGEMLDGFYQEGLDLLDDNSAEYTEFKEKLGEISKDLPETRRLQTEILEILKRGI